MKHAVVARKDIMLDFLGDLKRTHMCGELRAADAGSKVVLMGWVNKRRDLGNLIFLDLRDRSGITQVVITADAGAEVHDRATAVRSEFVVAVIGHVKLRDPNTVNKNIPTGEIEVVADELRVLNDCKPLPFSPSDTVLANEEVRLKYRYIDLRRPELQHNIELRHQVAIAIRDYLNAQGFYEIETPFMTRSTPEGARDYLVPSRVYPGEFYALPQSPQLFKQILMISGFDKYFQIVRCFRDEDLRADRQPEFTQIDLEISFPRPETVFRVVEGFLKAAFSTIGVDLQTPFPQMSYDQAIRLYGIDKPDLRLPAMAGVRDAFAAENLETLHVDSELPVVAIVIPKVGELSRKERDEIKTMFGERKDGKVFEDIKRLEKSFPEAVAKIRELAKPNPEDLVVVVAGAKRTEAAKRVEVSATGLCSLFSGGTASSCAGAEVCRAARRVQARQFPPAVGHRFPHVRVGRSRRPLERGASSLHLAARAGHGQAGERSRRGARAGLRRGAERHRAGLGLDPYSPPGHSGEDLQGAGHVAGGAAGALRLLSGGAAIRHAAARRHRAGTRPHRDDPGRRGEPARGDSLPQDGEGR